MSNSDSTQYANDKVSQPKSFENQFSSSVDMTNPNDVQSVFKNRNEQNSSVVSQDGYLQFSNPYGSKQSWDNGNPNDNGYGNVTSPTASDISSGTASQDTSAGQTPTDQLAQATNSDQIGSAADNSSGMSFGQYLQAQLAQIQQQIAQIGAEIAQDFGSSNVGSTGDAPAASAAPNASTGDAPAAPASSNASTGDAPAAPSASNASTGDAPAAPAASNASTGDAPAASASANASTGDAPAAPASSSNASSGDAPAAPASSSNASSGDAPAAPSSSNASSGDAPAAPASSTASNDSGFTIQNGQILMNGKLLSGVAVTGEYAQQVGPQQLAQNIENDFPGINVVRLATSPDGGAFTNGSTLQGGQSVSDINQDIQALNADGIGVIVDNHGSDANTQNNVSQDGSEASWFAQLAAANINNPDVMFQTENEPTGSNSDIVSEQQSAYSAIRGTGSNAIVAFDLEGGGSAAPMESDTAAYDADSNYVIDAHAYASNNSDPASATAGEVAQTSNLTEASGGAVPVYIGETGNSIDGSDIDPQATAQLNTDWSDGTGAIAWLYDGAATGFGSGNGADHLTNSDGSLSSYGQEVQALIAQGAS
jgi:trimeric autotransporter adhesin